MPAPCDSSHPGTARATHGTAQGSGRAAPEPNPNLAYQADPQADPAVPPLGSRRAGPGAAGSRRGGRRGLTEAMRPPLRARFALASLFVIVLAGGWAAGWGSLHETLRAAGFDVWQRLLPRERFNDAVIVVAIDDASIAALGVSPWPRVRVAELLQRIRAAQPAAIGLNIFFAEADRLAPARLQAELGTDATPAVRAALATLPDPDRQLAAALAAGPVALAVAGLDQRDAAHEPIGYRQMVLAHGGDPAPHLRAYPGMLGSIATLQSAANGHGVTNAPTGADGVLRNLPALVHLGGSTTPALALELLRQAANDDRLVVRIDAAGLRSVEVAGRRIPTDANGDWWLHFSEPAQRPVIPAAALLGDPRAAQALLRGRVVLIGYTAHGLQDLVLTPRGRMAGVFVQAEAIDNAIDGRLLQRPRWAGAAEVGATLLLALAAALARSRRPRTAVLGGLGATLLLALAGAAAFQQGAWLIDVASPLLAGWLALGCSQALALGETQWQRRQLRQALQASREAAARGEGELDAARRIQLGMLPDPSAVLGGEARVELAAAMQSARQVGGDLYDFFMPTPEHLFFLIGDVSGKGVPASLFMALSKVMIRSEALRGTATDGKVEPPAEVLSRAAAALTRENPESLFVTVFAGCLDLHSGELVWCAAGHDLPYLLRPDGGRALRLRGAVGPPLAVADDDYRYPGQRLQLQPGDALLLYSDGLTDMQNPAGENFGHVLLGRCLDSLADGLAAALIVQQLRDTISAHAAGTEPADDLALLVLRWRGPAAAKHV